MFFTANHENEIPKIFLIPSVFAKDASVNRNIRAVSRSTLTKLRPLSRVILRNVMVFCRDLNSAADVSLFPGATCWTGVQMSGLVFTPKYLSRAHWLVDSLCFAGIASMSIFSPWEM